MMSPPSNSNSTQTYPGRSRQHLARNLLAIACLWPLFFLIIPPPTADPAHMAILSAGMSDTMIDYSDSNNNSNRKSLTSKFQSIKRRAHDKIDNIRAVTSRRVNLAAKTQFLREEMSTLLRRKDVVGYVGYGPDRPRVAVVVVVPPSNAGGENEESRLLKGALDAVQSVFLTTDRNRIFLVTVVMDGRGKVGTFEAKLEDIRMTTIMTVMEETRDITIPKRSIHFTTMKRLEYLRQGKKQFTLSIYSRGSMSKQGLSLQTKI